MSNSFLVRPDQETFCGRLTWRRLIEVLMLGKKSQAWRSARISLCHLQKGIFAELGKALQGNSAVEASWDEPFFQMAVPVQSKATIKRTEGNTEAEIHDWVLQKIAADLQILTAGAAIAVREDGMMAALLVEQLRDSLAFLTPAEVSRFAQAWCDPTCFGDLPGDGSLEIELVDGRQVRAELYCRVYPWFSSPSTGESFHRVDCGITWPREVSPCEWSDAEKEALLRVLDRAFAALVSEAKTGRMSPWSIEEKIEGGTAVFRFTFNIRTAGSSDYFRRSLPRTLDETPLAGLPLNQYDAAVSEPPVLPVTDETGNIDDWALTYLLAAMAHPTETKHYEEFICRTLVSCCDEEALERLSLVEGLVPVLARAPSLEATLQRVSSSGLGGAIAGEMLLFLLTLAEYAPEHATVGKTAFLEEWNLEERTDRRGRRIRAKRSKILADWSRFKPVAHLCAAYRICQFDNGGGVQFFPESPEDSTEVLRNFFTLAEGIRLKAVSFKTGSVRGPGGPILDPTTTWRLPPGFVHSDVQFSPPPIGSRWIDKLKEYRRRDRPR